MTAVPRLIGGEMLTWSDAGSTRPPAGGSVFTHLLTRAVPTPARVLLAGPHDTPLVSGLVAAGARVTCLLRSLPDATAVARCPGVEVLCGTLPKLPLDERFDAVVALDGVDRLCSVEGPQLGWAESVQTLRRAVRPGGLLVLAAENDLGVHALVDAGMPGPRRDEGGWSAVGEYDPTRPGSVAALDSRLADAGLRVHRCYTSWADPRVPRVLAATEPLSDPDAAAALAAVVAAACGAAHAGRPVLTDPRRLAGSALRAGQAVAFAPGWLVVAAEPGRNPAVALPEVVVADGVPDAVQEWERDRTGRWIRRPVGPTAAQVGEVVRRDPAVLAGPVPGGRLLEEVLLAACLRRDLPELRRRLRAYAGWGGGAFATFDNVLVEGDRLALLDPGWSLVDPVPAPVAAVRAVRRFAVTVTTGGYSHPWPAADVDDLTAVLAAAAGLPVHDGVLPAAVTLEADICAAERGLTADERDALLDRLRAPDAAAAVVGPDGWREREEALRRLREQLAHAQAQLAWYDRELTARDHELRRARLQITAFSGSPGYRLARFALAAARRGRALVRRVLPRR